jgi:hypothetical protein
MFRRFQSWYLQPGSTRCRIRGSRARIRQAVTTILWAGLAVNLGIGVLSLVEIDCSTGVPLWMRVIRAAC